MLKLMTMRYKIDEKNIGKGRGERCSNEDIWHGRAPLGALEAAVEVPPFFPSFLFSFPLLP